MLITGFIVLVGGTFLEAVLPKNRRMGRFHWITLAIGWH